MKHLRNRIATTVLVAALGVVGAACEAGDVEAPAQEEGVTDLEDGGDAGEDDGTGNADSGEDEGGGLGY